jgi:hypothetical protein
MVKRPNYGVEEGAEIQTKGIVNLLNESWQKISQIYIIT